MVSCLSFCTWPEANPRKRSPGTSTSAPTINEFLVGRASQTYTTAKINPRGTRMRRATRDHVSPAVFGGCAPDCEGSLTDSWKSSASDRNSFLAAATTSLNRDFEHPLFRFVTPGVVGHLLALRRTIDRVPNGPLRAGFVGPKIATTGIFNAAARCIGPVSPPMNRRARRVSAINSETGQEIFRAAPALAASTAAASSSSPGP